MVAFFSKIFIFLFGNKSWLATIIVSMFPIIELKGAIPVGMSREFWGPNALSEKSAFLFSLIGSCLVVPLIVIIFRPILKFMKGTRLFKRVAEEIELKVDKSKSKISKNISLNSNSKKIVLLKMLGVFCFVAIPLPLTGVWTGTCIAVSLGLNMWQILVSCISGNIVAGILIMFVCSIFPNFTTIIFFCVLAIVLFVMFVMIVKILFGKKKRD